MEYVYILWHIHKLSNDEDDLKVIGVYSSELKAQKKISEYKLIPGFKDSPEGFEIAAYKIDSDHWIEGFVST